MKTSIFATVLFFTAALLPHSAIAYSPDTSAEAACLMIADSAEVVYEKNAREKLPMASTTKIMTALVALQKSSPDDIVTVSANAESQEGSSIYLARGDKIRMEDLLYGLMLNSGNDAAVAIAEYISGNTAAFADEMTLLAQKIGAKNTVFKNPSGLYEDGHYTTAYDLALIARHAMSNPTFRKIVSTKSKAVTTNSGDVMYFTNHNKLLKMYDGACGIKTGYTKKCGRCLVSAAEKDGTCLIGVTLNDPNDWEDHSAMFDYGFAGAKKMTLIKGGDVFKTVYTKDNRAIECVLKSDADISVFGNNRPDAEIITHFSAPLKAPITAGEKIGEAEIAVGGKTVSTIDILCRNNIEKTKKSIFLDTFSGVFLAFQKIYLQ